MDAKLPHQWGTRRFQGSSHWHGQLTQGAQTRRAAWLIVGTVAVAVMVFGLASWTTAASGASTPARAARVCRPLCQLQRALGDRLPRLYDAAYEFDGSLVNEEQQMYDDLNTCDRYFQADAAVQIRAAVKSLRDNEQHDFNALVGEYAMLSTALERGLKKPLPSWLLRAVRNLDSSKRLLLSAAEAYARALTYMERFSNDYSHEQCDSGMPRARTDYTKSDAARHVAYKLVKRSIQTACNSLPTGTARSGGLCRRVKATANPR